MEAPVFYDPSGRRRRWSKRILLGLIIILMGLAVGVGPTILNVPAPDPLKLGIAREQPRALPSEIGHLDRSVKRRARALTSWLPGANKKVVPTIEIVVGFYVPTDDGSRLSLIRHIGDVDWVAPVLGSVVGADHDFQWFHDRPLHAILAASARPPSILPVVQNIRNGVWDGENMGRLLRDKAATAKLLDQVQEMLEGEHAYGVVFDFEDLPANAQGAYLRFIDAANKRFSTLVVTVAVPVDNEDWDLRAYARVADKLFIMDY